MTAISFCLDFNRHSPIYGQEACMSVARVVEVRLEDEVVWKAEPGDGPTIGTPWLGAIATRLLFAQQAKEGPNDPMARL